jgi:hypothetical protein
MAAWATAQWQTNALNGANGVAVRAGIKCHALAREWRPDVHAA